MTVPIEPELRWLAAEGLPPRHGRTLLRLLEAVSRSDSLRAAARIAGVSYRHAWGLLGAGARALGAPVVELQRGRGARLTALGERLLEADAHVRATLETHFEKLRTEVRAMLEPAVSARQPVLALRASHDLLLPELARLCAPRLRLEIAFRGADDSLSSLARGECDLAGFHVADALPRAAAAAASLGRWLDPRRHQLVHFVAREQGIIVRPGARIRSVHDLARPGVRFINRPPGGAAREDLDLAIAAEVAAGRADAGFGLRAAAARHKLDFVPLATERYYLAATRRALREAPMQALLAILRGPHFLERVARLPGYDASNAGAKETLGAALGWLVQPRPRKASA
jgi:molybdate transport repressor ModE-like protein